MRRVNFRLSDEDYKCYQKQAICKGVSLSNYLRTMLRLGSVLENQEQLEQENRRTFELLERVGRIALEGLILQRCMLKEQLGSAHDGEFHQLLKAAFSEAEGVIKGFVAGDKEFDR